MKPSSESERFMRRAIQLSRRGYPAPNPHVGCVIVAAGKIVGEGYCAYAGGDHAEVMALKQAGGKAAGADLYVTLEPCNHQGRTGPCSEAVIAAGIKRVFIACTDPNPKAKGGIGRLQQAEIEVHTGLLDQQAAAENLQFLEAFRMRRPYVVLKAAASLDGRIALPSGESKWITGEAARREGHKLRAQLGAVLVGSGTIIADDPALTARVPGVKNQPLKVVLDPERRLDGTQRVFQGPAKCLHVVSSGSQGPNTLQLSVNRGTFDLNELVGHLWKEGVTGLLVEGGPTTLTSFIKQQLADRIELFLAPKLMGSGFSWLCDYGLTSLEQAIRLSRMRVRKVGADLRITAYPEWPRPRSNSNCPGSCT